ncbi:sugar isomerase domain-containing protein [Alicyclobacillus shizuokensis]|uniref:sugar isomerase domain-containing protein n=1 Tax=Alicyclobacillus shizuokensis TaxID=392014 RepID=UPI00082ACF1E|nr:sugar isomerase domain-containing protein [Alicyclobacillus shizuokensis]
MANAYVKAVAELLEKISGQEENICRASAKAADAIASGHWVRMFGSGHSVLPIQDCFPRYGGYVGFYPIMDPRLMWTTVSGPGGAEELLWLERQEGYMDNFLRHNQWDKDDVLIVISHGGQNAAPVEVALAAKEAGLYVIAITSMENHLHRPAIHSSGKKIGDIADLIIDNCVAPEDAVVAVNGVVGKVGGTSTLAALTIVQSIVVETAKQLAERGHYVRPFASPNTLGIDPGHNEKVYVDYRARLAATTRG